MKQATRNVVKFKLVNTALDQEFGEVSFNGRFIFELDERIDPEVWQKVGIIPLEKGKRRVEVKDLFRYLNSRLPQSLREASSDKKIEYIRQNGLQVASDNFRLQAL